MHQTALNPEAVKTALQDVIGHIDYDTAKLLDPDCNETGEDGWPTAVDRFVKAYGEASAVTGGRVQFGSPVKHAADCRCQEGRPCSAWDGYQDDAAEAAIEDGYDGP